MLQNFGTALSREQMRNLKGGWEEVEEVLGECSAKAHCTGCRQAKCTGTSSCNATDDHGVTCDGTFIACKKGGEAGCV
jgi:hypothetical protein